MEKEWDEVEEKPSHNVHEETTYEQAERELKAQERIERNKLESYD